MIFSEQSETDKRMLASEGYPTIFVVFLFSALVAWAVSYLDHWIVYFVYAALVILCGLILYFFRDPDRETPDDTNLIVAPADGKVVLVKQVEENSYLKQNVTQISIFLSPLDVHVNRVPVKESWNMLSIFPVNFSWPGRIMPPS